MLDLQHEQYQHGQPYADLYEGVQAFKKRYALHDVRALPRDSLAVRRDAEREQVQELVKRFRDIPDEQQKRLPALLNSLAQLELIPNVGHNPHLESPDVFHPKLIGFLKS